MKKTGRTMTLSGQLPRRNFQQQLFRNPHPILEYANVLDINRAWRVKFYQTWVQETPTEMGFQDGCYWTVDTQLSTDNIPGNTMWNNAGENRAIAWETLAYDSNRASFKGVDPGSPSGEIPRNLMNVETWIHPDHIIQNKLTISAHAFGTNYAENATYVLNYIVELEEVEISPSESIVFNIKSKAQDLET